MFVAHFENTMRNAKFKRSVVALPVNNNVDERRKPVDAPTIAEFQKLMRRVEALELAGNRVPLTLPPKIWRGNEFATIVRRICRVFNLPKSIVFSKRRNPRVVLARQAIMYWAYRLTIRSLPEIGRMLGGRDHTTVLHGKQAYLEKRAAMGRYLRLPDQRQGPAA